ncbi:MAG: trigger factor [Solobacterium sp.]|nr:trigger factor [Solobacterium sp.]
MAANWTLKEKSTGELIVTVDGDTWKEACEKAFRKLAANVTINGFRKGQAPKKILDQRIPASERQVQAVQDNMNAWLISGMQEAGVEPISRPDVDIRNIDSDHVELAYTFAVMPEVKLGEYKGLEYRIEDVEVSDSEFDSELNRMREQYSDIETVDGAAEDGDTVTIDYEGFKDGVPFEGGKAENYKLTLGSHAFIPGFEEQLVGAKAGEDKELNLKFPEDYHAEDLKGADVVFKVHVHDVTRKVLPEVDDDFAKDVNIPGVETVDDLKAKIRERLAESKKQFAENTADAEFLETLGKTAEIDIPDVLVQEEQQNMVNQMAAQIQQYGMDIQQYLKMMGKKIEDLAKDYEEDAKKTVRNRLILDKIAELENIVPTDEEVETEFQNIADMYQMELEAVKSQLDKDIVKSDIAKRQAFDKVKELANRVLFKREEKAEEPEAPAESAE